jgi:hypothetical protein
VNTQNGEAYLMFGELFLHRRTREQQRMRKQKKTKRKAPRNRDEKFKTQQIGYQHSEIHQYHRRRELPFVWGPK